MKTSKITDAIVKWFFVLLVCFFAAGAISLFLVDDETRKEASEKAKKSTEKARTRLNPQP